MHKVGIIHADIKPDNIMVINEGCEEGNELSGCILKLIDFGRSIDTTILPANTKFIGDCHADSFRCIEMQKQQPWTFQVDIFGICCVVHALLHGRYMEIETDKTTGQYKPLEPFKRYWNVALWQKLFSTLLNITQEQCTVETLSSILSSLRSEFEQQLATTNLSVLLAKQHIMIMDRIESSLKF